MFRWLLVLGCVAAFAGCTTTRRPAPTPLTQEEIIQMAQAHTADKDIIERIKLTGTVYRLTTAEVLHLHEARVSNEVIDFMLQDYVEAVRWQEQRRAYYYDWYSYGPHSYWCWPHEVIVVRGRR